MARKTTDKGSKAGSNPSTDETASDAKAGADQTPAPETAESKPLGTTPSDDSVAAQPVLPNDSAGEAEPTVAMGPETGSVQEPVTTPEAAPVLPGPEVPQTPGTDGVSADAAGASEDKSAPPTDTVKPISAAPSASSGGGFLPLVLGGIVAGAIGYGAHYIVSQDSGEQAEEIGALQAEIAQLRSDMPAMPDISALESEITELRAALDAPLAEVDALRAEIAESDADGLDPDVLDQLSADLTDVTARLEGLEGARSDRDSQIAALQDELSEIRDIAENRVAQAEAALDTALARAGLDMLRAALNAGTPYSDAVALLGDAGVTVPQTIAANAPAGVPTLEMLQETYPDAARAGLRAALQETPAESAGERVANFLRAQTGARSTTPREGDDPDAILSRAAAALEEGALDMTLAELDTLPEAAQATMADWRSAAQARLEAGAEFETFATTISTQ